jgi:hypothetical protein
LRRVAVVAIETLYTAGCTRRGTVTKLALRLLILMAVVGSVAALCGGWKWDGATYHGASAGTHASAEVNV